MALTTRTHTLTLKHIFEFVLGSRLDPIQKKKLENTFVCYFLDSFNGQWASRLSSIGPDSFSHFVCLFFLSLSLPLTHLHLLVALTHTHTTKKENARKKERNC